MHAPPESRALSLSDRVRGERPSAHSVEPDNRRSDKRFTVPGSLVHVPCRSFQVCGAEIEMRDMLFGVVPSLWMQRREVINISKGGLAFESRSPVARGRKLRLQLWVPGREEALELSGETRWCKRLLGKFYSVGLQFDAFGHEPGVTQRSALGALRELENKYA